IATVLYCTPAWKSVAVPLTRHVLPASAAASVTVMSKVPSVPPGDGFMTVPVAVSEILSGLEDKREAHPDQRRRGSFSHGPTGGCPCTPPRAPRLNVRAGIGSHRTVAADEDDVGRPGLRCVATPGSGAAICRETPAGCRPPPRPQCDVLLVARCRSA